jgi:hypothetical protein
MTSHVGERDNLKFKYSLNIEKRRPSFYGLVNFDVVYARNFDPVPFGKTFFYPPPSRIVPGNVRYFKYLIMYEE